MFIIICILFLSIFGPIFLFMKFGQINLTFPQLNFFVFFLLFNIIVVILRFRKLYLVLFWFMIFLMCLIIWGGFVQCWIVNDIAQNFTWLFYGLLTVLAAFELEFNFNLGSRMVNVFTLALFGPLAFPFVWNCAVKLYNFIYILLYFIVTI